MAESASATLRRGNSPVVSRLMVKIGAAVTATLLMLSVSPTAAADPGDAVLGDALAPVADQPVADQPVAAPVSTDEPTGDPVTDACKQFALAAGLAASNYEDFAYASAGHGDFVDYQDPSVERTSLVGRAALRTAAGTVLDASRTPGLPPEVSDPMQSWSLHATKLIFIMGLRGGGDSLNGAVTQLNTDYSDAQKACAVAMAHRGADILNSR